MHQKTITNQSEGGWNRPARHMRSLGALGWGGRFCRRVRFRFRCCSRRVGRAGGPGKNKKEKKCYVAKKKRITT